MLGLEQGNVILNSGNVSANLFLRYQPVSSSYCSSGLITEWIQALNQIFQNIHMNQFSRMTIVALFKHPTP